MGRHRRKPHDSKKDGGTGASKEVSRIIEEKLGHNDLVCQDCDARSPSDATNCRKCNSTNLRPVANDFRGGGHSGSHE